MSLSHKTPPVSDRTRSSTLLLPALLFSLAVHAVASALLFSNWHPRTVEPPPALTVKLEAPPPVVVSEPPPPVERRQTNRAAIPRATPAVRLQRAPVPNPVVIERVEPAPLAIEPAPEIPPASVVVAKAAATVSQAVRVDAVEPPHFNVAYLNNPRPAYPSIARKLGLEGVVVLRVQVNAAGAPEQVAVTKTSGVSVLDDAALKAVRGWTFVPARRGDTPVAHPVDVPIRFQLKNSGRSD